MRVESKRLRENGASVVNDAIDATKLLEELNRASDKESPSTPNVIISEDVLERSQEIGRSNRVLNGDRLHNARIDGFDFILAPPSTV